MSSKIVFFKSELRRTYLTVSSSLDTRGQEADIQWTVNVFLKHKSQNAEWKFLCKVFTDHP